MAAEEVVVALDKAFTSKDNRAIVDILTKMSNFRRIEIVEAYRMKFGKDLTLCTINKLKPNFEKVFRSLIVPLPTFLARELHKAIKSPVRVDRDAILEILSGPSTNLLRFTTSQYELIYGRSLEIEFLEMAAEEDFKTFCISLSLTSRPSETANVDSELVCRDAKALFNAGEGRYWWSDDENESCAAVELAVWIALWSKRSRKHLRQVFSEYNDLAKTSIEEAIKKQFHGDLKIGFLTLAKCIRDKAAFYAERLHYSMKGVGTNDDTLIRAVITNADVGFSDIKDVFKKKYKGTLEDWIADDTSGDYRYFLLSLVSTKKRSKEFGAN
uniref:Annexin-B9 n=1 Tax=Lygus hesperus TaxID=30085 RepID=A0A0A9YNF3_LYGHE